MLISRRSAPWLLLTLLLLLPIPQSALPTAAPAEPAAPLAGSADVPIAAQYRFSEQAGADNPAYHFRPSPNGFQAVGRALQAEVVPAGALVRLGAAAVTIAPAAFGRARPAALPAAGDVQVAANRLERQRGPLREWFVNGPLGFQQAWTVPARPSGNGPLTLDLALSGGAVASAGERDVTITTPAGGTVPYGGLLAYDAAGRELPARFIPAGDRLAISVDDGGALYPIVIDPYVMAAVLTSGASNAEQMGMAAAMSADGSIAAFTAANAISDSVPTTAVYVFTRPAGGWTASSIPTARLYSGPGPASAMTDLLAISADGSTIAAASRGFSSFVNIFSRPPGGWSGILHRTATVTSPDISFGPTGFPQSVTLSNDGSILAAGDSKALGEGPLEGAVFVFNRPGATWSNLLFHSAKLFVAGPLFPGSLDLGAAVSISADGATILAGAPLDLPSGGAYVFNRPGPAWITTTQSAKLTSNVFGLGQRYGSSLALSGDGTTAAVGGCAPIAPNICNSVDVFVRAGSWTTATATANLEYAGQVNAGVGRSLAIANDGSRVIAAAAMRGRAGVFNRPANGWKFTLNQTEEILPIGAVGLAPLAGSADLRTVAGGDVTWRVFPDPLNPGFVAAGAGQIYVEPTILSFSPKAGKPGDVVSITGQNLDLASGPRFGGTAAFASGIVSPTLMTATVGTGASGLVSLQAGGATISSSEPFTFTRGPSTTTISQTAPSTSATGLAVPIGFDVSTALGKPAGTVTVTASTGESCTGQATGSGCSITFATPGARVITATFGQTAAFSGSVSGPISHTVLAATSTSLLFVGAQPIPLNQPATFLYTVFSSFGPPTGMVTVTAATGESCSGPVVAGGCPLTFATAGSRVVTATYGGSATFFPSQATQTVRAGVPTTTTITGISPAAPAINQSVTVSFAVTSTAGTPTGTVRVSTGLEQCTAPAPVGSCSLVFAFGGQRTVSVDYLGNDPFAPSGTTGQLSIMGPPILGPVSLQVLPSSAMLKFDVFPNGTQTLVFVDYWTTGLPAGLRIAQQLTQTVAGPVIPAGQFSTAAVELTLGGLQRNTSYAVQVRLVTPQGVILSPVQPFTTGAARTYAPLANLRIDSAILSEP
ncbi:MAG: hypothetical protein U0556_07575 [Dehalococcoidia bacterium]